MSEGHGHAQRLTPLELASLDLTITAMQASGAVLGDQSRDDNPREQMAEALAELHMHGFPLSEHDRERVAEIRRLASQLESRTTLENLIQVRGSALQER
jgi:hypothetical protein